MSRPPISLTNLPPRIKNKIRCDGDETTACWCWTGSFRPPSRRHKEYPVADDFQKFRHTTGCLVNARGLPTMWVSALGYPTAAYRVVYAVVHGLNLKEVPKLIRCTDDRCVSPYHVQDGGPVPQLNQHAGAMRVLEQYAPQAEPHPRPQLVGDPAAETPLETLQRVRPFCEMSIESAEDECELPRGSITPEVWAEYVLWDENSPD